MNKRVLIGCSGMIVCLVASVLVTVVFGNKGTSLGINLFFAILMFLIIFLSMMKISKFVKLVEALSKGTDKLDSMPDNDASAITNGSEVFEDNEKLVKLMDAYYKENDGFDGEISDYINEDLLDEEINKQVTELVAGIMTGLGLLGTFVGFMVGIKDLNLNQDELFDSIRTLMDGMKTAFLTSIFGVIYSLLFNVYYKRICSYGSEELNRFYDTFYDKVASDPEKRNVSLILDFQRRQTEVLEKLPYIIASAISDKINDSFGSSLNRQVEVLETLPVSITSSIVEEMENVFAPTLNKMDSLMENFVNVATANQQESLERVVNSFIASMNNSLNDKFVLLGETLDKTCQLQTENFEMMEKVVSTITSQTEDLDELNSSIEESLADITDYGEQIKKYNESILEYNKETHKLIADVLTAQNDANEAIKDFTENVTDMAIINKETTENFRLIQEFTASAVDDMRGQIEEFAKTAQHLSNEIKSIGNKVHSECRGLEESLGSSLNTTFKVFDRNLAEITTHLNSSIKEMQELVDKLPVDLGTSIGKLRASMNECVSLLNDTHSRKGDGKK